MADAAVDATTDARAEATADAAVDATTDATTDGGAAVDSGSDADSSVAQQDCGTLVFCDDFANGQLLKWTLSPPGPNGSPTIESDGGAAWLQVPDMSSAGTTIDAATTQWSARFWVRIRTGVNSLQFAVVDSINLTLDQNSNTVFLGGLNRNPDPSTVPGFEPDTWACIAVVIDGSNGSVAINDSGPYQGTLNSAPNRITLVGNASFDNVEVSTTVSLDCPSTPP
jgi:hypothetical protein